MTDKPNPTPNPKIIQELTRGYPELAEVVRGYYERKLNPSSDDQPKNRKNSWTVSELYDTNFPEPSWIIPGIFPVGLVFLGGQPKVGKSWLLLQIAYGVAMGGKLFDKDIPQGEVFYLAYEDNPRRIKDRCQKMGIPKEAPIRFEFTWRPLHQGGLDDLLIAIEGKNYKFVVVDTFLRSTPGVDHMEQREIGPLVDQLQRLAIDHNMTIALADHTRKPLGGKAFADPIDDIMGSTAKAAAADAVLAIYKEQGKSGASLKGHGKDIDDIDLALTFDGITGAWQSKGNAGRSRTTEARIKSSTI